MRNEVADVPNWANVTLSKKKKKNKKKLLKIKNVCVNGIQLTKSLDIYLFVFIQLRNLKNWNDKIRTFDLLVNYSVFFFEHVSQFKGPGNRLQNDILLQIRVNGVGYELKLLLLVFFSASLLYHLRPSESI